LAVVLISLAFLSNTMVSSLWSRADLTSESLYSLDKATLATLEKVRTNDLEVTIQAFVSKDVPRKFVNAKKQFVGLLRQFGEYGGKNINVRFVDVEPNSDEALDAKQQGIVPQDDRSEVAGKIVEQPVYLGAIISSSLNDVSLPFVGDDAAIEYELSRGIDSAIDTTKGVTLGILDTDALFGGPEVEGRRYPMAFAKTLERLKKQYKIKYIGSAELGEYVEPVGADTLAEEAGEEKKKVNQAPDVLLVADPSSLDDAAMVSLVSYVKAGNPTILLTDPLPFFWVSKYPRNVGVISAPSQPRFGERSPYFRTFSTSALPKSDEGSALKMMRAIGVDWDKGAAAWSVNDPHPSFKPAWSPQLGKRWPAGYGPEEKAFVFVRNVGESLAFNSESLMSQGLNELLMFYPGSIKKTVGSNLNFQPLVTLGKQSGKTPWEQLTKTPMQTTQSLDPRTRRITSQTGPEQNQITLNDTVIMEPAPQTFLDEEEHVLAARITGNEDQDLDVVVIADSDFVSDIYYEQQEALGQRLDNVAFLENAIDILVGNDDFVALRNRRATPRTLEKLESVIEEYRAEKAREQQKAESKVAKELGIEQDKLAEANKEIVGNQDLGYFQKLQQTRQQESDAERRFGLKQKRLDRELKDEIERLDTEQKNKISWLENRARFTSIFAAPLPALLLGVFVLWFRKLNEEKDIATERRVGRFS
jgi:ABC-2 type transport system permease protein